MKMKIENKVHEIANVLFQGMAQGKFASEDVGLLSGQMGVIIFCKHYLKAYPNNIKEEVLDAHLTAFFDRISAGTIMPTYCSGITGILDGLKYLVYTNLLDVDYSDVKNNYKLFLQEYSLTSIANVNYDYLHGGLGVVKYFADDPHFVNQALDVLEQTADKDTAGYKWKSQIGMEREIGYNISLSHGMSSIVSVLSLLIHPEIDKNKRDLLLTNACNFILSQEVDYKQYGCFFPCVSKEYEAENGSSFRSRLAWCYGDLGIATAFWQAGRVLNNTDWQNKAIEIFTFSACRRSQEESKVMDAELCHGTASVAMMFHYMFQQTQIELFRQTRDYWVGETLKIDHFEDGPAGYKVWLGVKNDWGCEYSLLEGIAGIGLLLMLAAKGIDDSKWMRFFLLNPNIIITPEQPENLNKE